MGFLSMKKIKYSSLSFIFFITFNNPSFALSSCIKGQTQTAFEIQALKTEMMLTAVTCEKTQEYNNKMQILKPYFVKYESVVKLWFNKKYTNTSVQKYDRYITDLANELEQTPERHNADIFCNDNVSNVFQDLDQISTQAGLEQYAHFKRFKQPGEIAWCSH